MSVETLRRVRIRVSGAVQGVGFRPFVYRLARQLGVTGWIVNDTAGVVIEVEGDEDRVARFAAELRDRHPPRAVVQELVLADLQPVGSTSFRILESDGTGARTAAVLPDLAICDDCARDIADPANRRAGYPFTNCTACGPRFSIIRALPYDRPNTTMAGFVMCEACAAEYADPADRRFHAQPNACPYCGPRVWLADGTGTPIICDDPISTAAAALRRGRIVAVKGLGGYHLMVDAASDAAVRLLRERKHRPTKPLAIMAADLAQARRMVVVDDVAAMLLTGPEAPIVLLPRLPIVAVPLDETPLYVAEAVAPGNPDLGVMLAATPLHRLLLSECDMPVVATSGNLAEEPICISEQEAFERLAGIADLFLAHDRPIERHVDDSVAAVMSGAPVLLRRARGWAPLPVVVDAELPTVLALGAHLKNTIALSRGRQVFLSQHIGDLETREAQAALERVVADFLRLYEAEPAAIACDLHPDYASTNMAVRIARERGVPLVRVQHHHAHLAACMAENHAQARTLGVIWDGTGLGTDGTIWGGELLLGDAAGFDRVAHLMPFALPGGDAAVREPRRTAAALVHATLGASAVLESPALARAGLDAAQRRVLLRMMERGLNAPVTTSAGRLLDGIAALLGIAPVITYEGEAAIALEHCADPREYGAYPLPTVVTAGRPTVFDWRPLVRAVIDDAARGVAAALIAARAHNALVHAVALQAEVVGCERVALSGGCFQNRLLAERTAARLARHGFQVLRHHAVPVNDGGISLGQVMVAAARLARD